MNSSILPVVKCKEHIVNAIIENDILIVVGETGSGKTTQIPLYVQNVMSDINPLGTNLCCCTQPRRIAALSAAELVARDQNSQIGQKIGYRVRFDNCTSENTIICYMTDGILVNEIINDKTLSQYSSVILDEVHEGSIHNDLLMTLLLNICTSRNNDAFRKFKLIIMSATLNVCKFSQYFNDCKIVCITGRHFPINIYYSQIPQPSYLHSAIVTVINIHLNDKSQDLGSILIFLTGEEEIEAAANQLRKLNTLISKQHSSFPQLKICLLYANLPREIQKETISAPNSNFRKIILSTNIAETSVTIPGVKYIIDSGKVKRMKCDPLTGIESLTICQISKEQANQRAGRAGREQSGVCYRLYTEKDWNMMDNYSDRALSYSDLTLLVLEMIAVGIKNVYSFKFFQDPNPLLIKRGLYNLLLLECISKLYNRSGSDYELNSIGRKIVLFPLNPFYSKLIINSIDYSCINEMLIMVSIMSLEEFLYIPFKSREKAFKMLNNFNRQGGDHILYLDIAIGWISSNYDRDWGKRYFLNWKNSVMFSNIHRQISSIFSKNFKSALSCCNDIEDIQKCLLSVLYINLCEYTDRGQYFSFFYKKKFYIHPSSSYFLESPKYIIFTKLIYTNKPYMKIITPVKKEWIESFILKIKEYHVKNIFSLDNDYH